MGDDTTELPPPPQNSQEHHLLWETSLRNSGLEEAPTIEPTFDGGYIMTAMTYPSLGNGSWSKNVDIWLVKMDESGSVSWEKTLGSSGSDHPFFILPTTDGEYLLGANSTSADGHVNGNNGVNSCWLVKLDGSGNIIWETNLEGSLGNSAMSAIQEGNAFLVAGVADFYDNDFGNETSERYDLWIVKINDQGEILWENTYGEAGTNKIPVDIHRNNDNGYLVAGSGNQDLWLTKFDDDFNIVWDKRFGGSQNEWLTGTALTESGIMLVANTASSDGDITGNYGSVDIWVAEIDNQGEILWENSYGGSSHDIAVDIVAANDHEHWVASYTSSSDGHLTGIEGGADYWVLRLDPTGNILWNQTYGGSLGEKATSAAASGSHGIIVAGSIQDLVFPSSISYIWLTMIE